MRRRRSDDGVAAVEFAIVSTLFMLLAFGAMPLYSMARGYQKVSGGSTSALRYATSVDANGSRTTNPDGTTTYSRRPTALQVQAFVRDADPTLAVMTEILTGTPATWTPGDPRSQKSGDSVRVTVSTPVDLGVLGPIANAVGSLVGAGSIAPEGVLTMTSTATGREE